MSVAQPVEFLPGDRVRYTDQHPDALPEYRGMIGTIVNINDRPVSTGIRWDGQTIVSYHSNGFFYRQPVTPGCWVRSIRAGYTDIRHHVTDIDGRWLYTPRNPTTHDRAEFTKLDPIYFVRIADPEPVAAVAPAPVELIAGQYLPGDRIVGHGKIAENLKRQTGTVIKMPSDVVAHVRETAKNDTFVHFDNDPMNAHWRAWNNRDVGDYLTREPVKVGSFVRLHQPKLGDYRYLGKVTDLMTINGEQIAIVANGGYFVSSLVTVAEQKPYTIGNHIFVDASDIAPEVVSYADAEPLATRLFYWSRVGAGSVDHCRDCELASQAIEEAAAQIAPDGKWNPDTAREWLTKYAPDKLPKPPVFKRGDLVDVDRGDKMVPASGRIVSPDGDRPIVEVVTKFGDFINTDVDHIKHSTKGH